jgi:two-component system phosphate regulon sensor histidine kinase PhoR
MLLSFRYFKVHDFLEEIIQEFVPRAEKKNLSLILLPVDKSLKIYGDRQRLRQVMVNLITNALKYTDTGSVTIGIADETGSCRIIVRDTGIGIPADDLKRIFERFYRVDKDRSRMMGGTGLGLAIVKHIVEAHGYKVEVSSEMGKGTEFSFRVKK